MPPEISPERYAQRGQWGMASFLVSEVAFFGTLIVTYVAFMGEDIVGPTPAEALSLPLVIVSTLCLLSSSFVIHAAEQALERGQAAKFLSAVGRDDRAGNRFSCAARPSNGTN